MTLVQGATQDFKKLYAEKSFYLCRYEVKMHFSVTTHDNELFSINMVFLKHGIL